MSKHKYTIGDRLILGNGGRDGWERYEGREIVVTGLGHMGGEFFYDSSEMTSGTWEGWVVGLAPSAHDRQAGDFVNHPSHYTSDPSGVECITITRHRTFNIGNAIKYLWRAGLKVAGLNQTSKEKQVEDLRKAIFYIEDEIKLLESK